MIDDALYAPTYIVRALTLSPPPMVVAEAPSSRIDALRAEDAADARTLELGHEVHPARGLDLFPLIVPG